MTSAGCSCVDVAVWPAVYTECAPTASMATPCVYVSGVCLQYQACMLFAMEDELNVG